MTLKNKLLTYLGFCPTKVSAQHFKVRNNTTTWIQKEYRDAIIRGIVSGISVGVLFTIFLYLIALILLGANRFGPYPTSGGFPQNAVLKKAAVFIWGLMPSQNIGWWTISLVVLVILIILVFVAGCKLIAYFMRREGPAEGVR